MIRSRFFSRIVGAVAATMIVTAVILSILVRQQTISKFVVYRSSWEEIEQLRPQQRVLLEYQTERLAAALRLPGDPNVDRIVDAMAGMVGREIVAVRNQSPYFASSMLREMVVAIQTNPTGALVATITDAAEGTTIHVEIAPIVSLEISPFTPDATTRADILRVYTVPYDLLTLAPARTFQTTVTRSIFVITLVAAGLVTLIVAALLHKSLRPIRLLTSQALKAHTASDLKPVEPTGTGELRSLVEAYNAMVGAIGTHEESRTRMMADISHELRGPLTNLRSQIEAMQDGLIDPGVEGLVSLHEETMLLSRLVNDLHELALAESHVMRLDLVRVPLSDVVRDAVKALRASCDEGGVTLEVRSYPDPLRVSVDPQRLSQVVINLVQNALRYSTPGKTITVATSGTTISVADNGPGVAEADLERIFQRFYRPDPSRARESGGSGLGLAIARAIVEAHGGTITAAPNRPSGLVVTIDLSLPHNHGESV